MKNIDIHDYLECKEYNISYTTVSNYIRKKYYRKEAYIKQNFIQFLILIDADS